MSGNFAYWAIDDKVIIFEGQSNQGRYPVWNPNNFGPIPDGSIWLDQDHQSLRRYVRTGPNVNDGYWSTAGIIGDSANPNQGPITTEFRITDLADSEAKLSFHGSTGLSYEFKGTGSQLFLSRNDGSGAPDQVVSFDSSGLTGFSYDVRYDNSKQVVCPSWRREHISSNQQAIASYNFHSQNWTVDSTPFGHVLANIPWRYSGVFNPSGGLTSDSAFCSTRKWKIHIQCFIEGPNIEVAVWPTIKDPVSGVEYEALDWEHHHGFTSMGMFNPSNGVKCNHYSFTAHYDLDVSGQPSIEDGSSVDVVLYTQGSSNFGNGLPGYATFEIVPIKDFA